MENTNIQNNIGEDKELAEQLFTKEAFTKFEKNNESVPANYFENFESRVLNNIHASKKPARIIQIANWGKLAIAASFLTIIVSSYLFFQSNSSDQQNQSIVSLQEIPSTEIDAYVNSNEWVAEIDWQEEINIESAHLENLNNHLLKDSNNNQ
jgi:hypothetical protein